MANATDHYTFISTISVYEDLQRLNIDEECSVAKLENYDEEVTEKNYGALKAGCEDVVNKFFPNRALIIRPGLIVGPRFTYWPVRMSRGGKILAPNIPYQNMQFIDVRDLAKWIVRMVEKQKVGIFYATGLLKPINFKELLR